MRIHGLLGLYGPEPQAWRSERKDEEGQYNLLAGRLDAAMEATSNARRRLDEAAAVVLKIERTAEEARERREEMTTSTQISAGNLPRLRRADPLGADREREEDADRRGAEP